MDYHGDVLPFDQEQEDFQRAVRESLQTKVKGVTVSIIYKA